MADAETIEAIMGEGSLGEILVNLLGVDASGVTRFYGCPIDRQLAAMPSTDRDYYALCRKKAIEILGDVIQQWLIRHIARGIAPEAEGMTRAKSIEPQALFALADLLEEQGYPLAGIRMRRVIPQEGELLVFQYPATMPPSAIKGVMEGASHIKSQLAEIGRKVVVAVIPDTVSVTGFNVEGRQGEGAKGEG